MPNIKKTDADHLADAQDIIRQKNEQVRQLQRQLKERTRINDTAERIREEILGLEAYTPEPPKWLDVKPSGKSTGVPLLHLSDWHWGETVDPDQVGGMNAFNRKIAKQRVKILRDATVDLCLHHMTNPKYPGIVVTLGGDMITGGIHEDLRETNDGPVTLSVAEVEENIIGLLLDLADKFGKVFVPCVPGNHGRTTIKPRAKNRVFDSYEWLVYCHIERFFRDDPRVQVYVPNEVDAHFSIYGHRFMLTHGDTLGVKGGDGIIGSLGPIARGALKVGSSEASCGRDFDTLLIGHYHTYIPRGDAVPVLANGSLIGYNEYARLVLRAKPTRPTQALAFIHPDRGFTAQWAIYLDAKERKKVKEPWLTFEGARTLGDRE
jgi:predicted phosphodiesterase